MDVTSKRYLHATKAMEEESVEKMNRMFGSWRTRIDRLNQYVIAAEAAIRDTVDMSENVGTSEPLSFLRPVYVKICLLHSLQDEAGRRKSGLGSIQSGDVNVNIFHIFHANIIANQQFRRII